MSRKCKKEAGGDCGEAAGGSGGGRVRVAASWSSCDPKDDGADMLSAVIGASNVARWTRFKRNLAAGRTNEEFVKLLLDFAAKYLVKKKSTECTNNNLDSNGSDSDKTPQSASSKNFEASDIDDTSTTTQQEPKEHKHKRRKSDKQIVSPSNGTVKKPSQKLSDNEPKELAATDSLAISSLINKEIEITEVKDTSPKVALKKTAKKSKVDKNEKEVKLPPTKPSIMVNISNELFSPLQIQIKPLASPVNSSSIIENVAKQLSIPEADKEISLSMDNSDKPKFNEKLKKKKTSVKEPIKPDNRKAPELNEQLHGCDLEIIPIPPISTPIMVTTTQTTNTLKPITDNNNRNANTCVNCDQEHLNEPCPVLNANKIEDSMNSTEDTKNYSLKSLPNCLRLDETTPEHGLGVFTNVDLNAFIEFGPLIARTVKEMDVAEDCNMRFMFEIVKGETERIFFNTERESDSNWIRYLRPAPMRTARNVTVIHREDMLYFVTIRKIAKGEELLFWQDDVSNNKKKMEKTSCGGCNMTFQHPLYYRIHCSVFHDVRYSLTIRKYHCKVCGAAVLGKENIMKHASELHNGQGAYQCQFCKKFFLRLNYLEMHRTYGCSANPHRARPLCDFCGRKFCQPQKLKVHIKRMHSDLSEVLKEFQCKNCMKILGSRAALHRHFKEVHQKHVVGSCACNRCGKKFQNKSNLKIHMLTHSGIKPFKCNITSCASAFTTKQCLQLHYKKVHGYTEEMMPKIERSVDYTFAAYSGNGLDDEGAFEELKKTDDIDSSLNHSEPNFDTKLETSHANSTIEETKLDKSSPLHHSISVEDHDCKDIKLDLSMPPLRSSTPITSDSNEHQPEIATTTTTPTHLTSHLIANLNSNVNTSSATLDSYTSHSNMKILTKGCKKWIGEQEMYSDVRKLEADRSVPLMEEEQQDYEANTVNTSSGSGKLLHGYNRHESNASLLVEAALDSVCSEPNIDIDVSTTPNCTDTLVTNLYTLSNVHDNDSLADVSYPQSVDVTDSRDINLISPSVNEQISVTDDTGDELRHGAQAIIGIDYSSFHQEDFSQSPRNGNFREYMTSPQGVQPQTMPPLTHAQTQMPHVYEKPISPGGVASPPRYDFGAAVNPESDDSNGIGAQNLSLHNDHVKFGGEAVRDGIQLDLSIYKSHYTSTFDPNFLRKDARKFEVIDVTDHGVHVKNNYLIDNEDTSKFSLNGNVDNDHLDNELKDFEGMEDGKSEKDGDLDLSMRPDLRGKFDLDLDLRKSYAVEVDTELRRQTYEGALDEFRMKNYDLDNLDALRSNLERKTYESLMDDFRTDRNFEPLVLNPSELQGLDMSARGYHNYTNLNRYHHLYPEVERPTVDLRLNYSPPPPPPPAAYPHPHPSDILRVSLDLAPPGRHSVDLSLRSQIANSRLLTEHSRLTLEPTRLLPTELTAPRHIAPDARLLAVTDMSNRLLSDHTTNRLLSNDQLGANRLIGNEQRMLQEDARLIEQPRLLDQNRLLAAGGSMSPVSYTGYSVSPSPYHPTALPPRPHVTSPTPSAYHHYSAYY